MQKTKKPRGWQAGWGGGAVLRGRGTRARARERYAQLAGGGGTQAVEKGQEGSGEAQE
jgi:hypothetical protein